MKLQLLLPALAIAALLVACGSSGSEPPETATARAQAQATVDAAVANAEALGVTDQTRAYARQWCDPLTSLVQAYNDIEPQIATADASQDFSVLQDLVDALVGPLGQFKEDLDRMDPPADYADYHEAFQAEIDYAVKTMKLIQDQGFFAAALTSGDEPPVADVPPELEPALAIECGDQFLEVFGGDFFPGLFNENSSSPAPEETPCAGAGCSRSDPAPIGTAVETSDGQVVRVLDANLDAEDQVLAENDFVDPPAPGNRMVLVEVEVTYNGDANGDETLYVSSGQFSLTGSNNVVYNSYDDGVSCGFIDGEISEELFPGGTATGRVCFQYPEDEIGLILIAEPSFSFGSSSRRYLALD